MAMTTEYQTIIKNFQRLVDNLRNQLLLHKVEINELKEKLEQEKSKDDRIKELETELTQVKLQLVLSNQQIQSSDKSFNHNRCQMSSSNDDSDGQYLDQRFNQNDEINIKVDFESEDEDTNESVCIKTELLNVEDDECYRQNQKSHQNKSKATIIKANALIKIVNFKYKITITNKGNFSNENRLMCPCCSTTFHKPINLRQHIAKIHLCKTISNNVVYRCHICEKRFRNMKVLSKHLDSHKTDAIECTYCHALFKDNRAFRFHSKHYNCVKFDVL